MFRQNQLESFLTHVFWNETNLNFSGGSVKVKIELKDYYSTNFSTRTSSTMANLNFPRTSLHQNRSPGVFKDFKVEDCCPNTSLKTQRLPTFIPFFFWHFRKPQSTKKQGSKLAQPQSHKNTKSKDCSPDIAISVDFSWVNPVCNTPILFKKVSLLFDAV